MAKTAINSKQKGGEFERAVAQRLSLWVSDLTRDDCFWRTAMSGGRATSRAKRMKSRVDAHAGDIVATHPLGHVLLQAFTIECKFYRDLEWAQAVYNRRSSAIFVCIRQSQRDADRHGTEPMLIAKQNRQEEMVLTTSDGKEIFENAGVLHPTVYLPLYDMYAFSFRELLALPFSRIREFLQERPA